MVGGALFLKAAVAWYSIGLRGLILTKRVRIPVEVRPLPRAAQVTFAVNLGERRKP